MPKDYTNKSNTELMSVANKEASSKGLEGGQEALQKQDELTLKLALGKPGVSKEKVCDEFLGKAIKENNPNHAKNVFNSPEFKELSGNTKKESIVSFQIKLGEAIKEKKTPATSELVQIGKDASKEHLSIIDRFKAKQTVAGALSGARSF